MSVEPLAELVNRGFFFQTVPDEKGEIAVVVGSYGWHGYFDRIHVWGEHEAIAARELTDHRPFSGNVVWSYEGSACDAAQALLDLPKPGEPGAPTVARTAPSRLWLPALSSRKPE
ncbi:MAG: hypothetical protein ABWY11_19535 [Umezawaea sp.]